MLKYLEQLYNVKLKFEGKHSCKYYFSYGNQACVFEPVNLNSIIANQSLLETAMRKYHNAFKIIPNRYGEIISLIDEHPYALICFNNFENRLIHHMDIISNPYGVGLLPSSGEIVNWYDMWCFKVDYYEKVLNEKGGFYEKYGYIYEYLFGLSENAIAYIKDSGCSGHQLKIDFQHVRINSGMKLYDFYDPSNIIVDYACRDICEWIKSLSTSNISFDIEKLLIDFKIYNYSKDELYLFYARLLFPTFVYDILDNALFSDLTVDIWCVERIIKNYENIIINISEFLKKTFNLDTIEWLKKIG